MKTTMNLNKNLQKEAMRMFEEMRSRYVIGIMTVAAIVSISLLLQAFVPPLVSSFRPCLSLLGSVTFCILFERPRLPSPTLPLRICLHFSASPPPLSLPLLSLALLVHT